MRDLGVARRVDVLYEVKTLDCLITGFRQCLFLIPVLCGILVLGLCRCDPCGHTDRRLPGFKMAIGVAELAG